MGGGATRFDISSAIPTAECGFDQLKWAHWSALNRPSDKTPSPMTGKRLAPHFLVSAASRASWWWRQTGGPFSVWCLVFSPNSNRGASLGSHSKLTFLCLGLFLFFYLYFFLFCLSKQTHVFVSSLFFFLCFFLVGLFFQGSAKASYAPSPPLSTPSFLTHVWIISMRYFWVLFNFHMTVESVQLLFVYYSYSLMIS